MVVRPVVPMQHLNEKYLTDYFTWACTAALNTWVCSIDLVRICIYCHWSHRVDKFTKEEYRGGKIELWKYQYLGRTEALKKGLKGSRFSVPLPGIESASPVLEGQGYQGSPGRHCLLKKAPFKYLRLPMGVSAGFSP